MKKTVLLLITTLFLAGCGPKKVETFTLPSSSSIPDCPVDNYLKLEGETWYCEPLFTTPPPKLDLI
jgi:uncharacterized lipoprotein YmbA